MLNRLFTVLAWAMAASTACAQPSLLGVASSMKIASVAPGRATTDELIARLADDPADYGRRLVNHDTGFDPHTDTPDFHNFESTLGPDGDCAGMSVISRRLYLDARWEPGTASDRAVTSALCDTIRDAFLNPLRDKHTISGYPNLREASKDPQVQACLKRLMELGQCRNLSLAAARYLLPTDDWEGQLHKLTENLDRGVPTLLSMANPPHLGGHMLLCYQAIEYEKRTLLMIYDCNAGRINPNDTLTYDMGPDDTTYKTVMVYDKATHHLTRHARYKELFHYDYEATIVYEQPDPRNLPWTIGHFITKTVPDFISRIFGK